MADPTSTRGESCRRHSCPTENGWSSRRRGSSSPGWGLLRRPPTRARRRRGSTRCGVRSGRRLARRSATPTSPTGGERGVAGAIHFLFRNPDGFDAAADAAERPLAGRAGGAGRAAAGNAALLSRWLGGAAKLPRFTASPLHRCRVNPASAAGSCRAARAPPAVRKSFMPAARQLSRSSLNTLAVIAMMGTAWHPAAGGSGGWR